MSSTVLRFSLSVLLILGPVGAQEFRSYVGENNAVWESPTNWSPNLVPDTITEGARIDNGAAVNIGASHTISALELRGGSLVLNQNNELRTSVLLIDSAGFINGPGRLVVTQAGTIDDVSGVSFNNVTFRNEGVLNLVLGMSLGPDTVFENVNTTNFFDNSEIGIAAGAGDPGRIHNTGFLRKTTGMGTARIGRPIDNDNEIVSVEGSFAISGDVENSGHFRTEAAGELVLSGNNTMADGSRIFGDGVTRMTTGSLTVAAGDTIGVDNFLLDGGQILNSGVMNYQGADVAWDSGTLNGPGLSRILSGSVLTVEDSPTATILTGGQSIEIDPGGRMVFLSDRSNVTTNSPISLVNHGTIDFAGAGNIFQNGSMATTLMTLRNESDGRIVKSVAGDDETDIVADVISEGEIVVEAGDLVFFRKVDFSAPLQALPGTSATLRGGTSTPSILRAGSRLFGGGNFILRTPVEIPAGVVVEASKFEMESSSQLIGEGTFRALGEAAWVRGSLEDSITLEIAPAATMTLSGTGTRTIGSGATPTIRNQGRFEIGEFAALSSSGNLRFENEGVLALSETGAFNAISGAETELVNTGTIIKEAGTGTGSGARSIFPVNLDHRGTLEVRSGILDFFGEQTIAAPILVEAGGVLRLNGSDTTTFEQNGVITGDGILEHLGADIVIPAGVRTPFSNYTTPLGSGEVTGPGTFALVGNSSITRMTHIGPGVTEIAPGAEIEMDPSSIRFADGRTFLIRGRMTFLDGFSFLASNGFTLKNEGTLVFQDGASWNYGSGDLVVDNSGTIEVAAPVGQTVSFAPTEVTGSGVYDVKSGRLRFSRSVELNGHFRLAAGTELNGTGLTTTASSRISGVGVIGDSMTLGGTVAPGFSIGTLTVDGSATFVPGGTLEVDLGDGTSDQLVVSSMLDLGGLRIEPQLVPGHTPVVGESWTIATANSITGSVGLVAQDAAGPGFGFFVSVDGNELKLTYRSVESFQDAIEAATGLSLGDDPDLAAFATGDLDGDGVQDLTDWAFGGTLAGADSGRNLRVDSVTQTGPTTREVVLAFPIRSIVTDVTMSLESNTGLQGAFSQVLFAPVRTETREGILFQVVRVEVPAGPDDNFFRVRVKLN